MNNIEMVPGIILYWSYISAVLLMSFIPGFAIATRIRSLNNTERLAIAFCFSYIICVLLVPLFAIKLDLLARALFLFILSVSVLSLIWRLRKLDFRIKMSLDFKFLLSILIISLVSKFFIQTLWEYPVSGGDWIAHTLVVPYDFDIGKWAPPQDRTPFFNLLIYSYHHLLGTSLFQYWISQIVSVVANSVFVLPTYLIARNVFNHRVAKISTAFMVIAPWLVWQSIYTWPKNLAMYLIFLMIYFMFFKKDNKPLNYGLSGLFGALAFLTHNYTAFYILTALIAFIYYKKIYRYPILQELLKERFMYFFIVMAAVIAPYLLWMHSSYGEFVTSRLVYYPFSVKGYEQATYSNPEEIYQSFFNTPISSIIGIRISNAMVTLLPVALPINPMAIHFPTYNPVLYYMQDYPGALSFLMYLLVVLWFLRYLFRKTNTDPVLVIFILVPFMVTLIIAGWKDWGLLTYALGPTVPILIILGTSELCRFKNSRIKTAYLYLMFIACLIEGLIFIVLIDNFYLTTGGLGSVIKAASSIPGFQIASFISAHFLLNGMEDFSINAIISLLFILVIIYYILKNED
jgi:hypothetical protein